MDGMTFGLDHNRLPWCHDDFRNNATLLEEFDLDAQDSDRAFLAVSKAGELPFLIIDQTYEPCEFGGFSPGLLYAPETKCLFLGAGTRLLCYQLDRVRRVWEDSTWIGFWHWRRHGDTVFMAAETELAAWDLDGTKRWSTWVEPPWSFDSDGDQVHLDVMGKKVSFSVASGPTESAT